MEPRIIAGIALLSLAAGQFQTVAAATVDTTCREMFETCHPADEPSRHHPFPQPGPSLSAFTAVAASSSTTAIWDVRRWNEGVWR
jgi:hypothetical protein